MKYRHRILILLFFLSIITYLDRVCISVAGPRMQEELGISIQEWGWVVGVFTISYAVFEIPAGAMGDRVGTRLVLSRIVLWWSAFTSLTGVVSSFRILLAVRFLFGMGEAGAMPNGAASIARWFPTVERGRAQGIMWMATRVGSLLSPLLVVPIQRNFGWRTSFYVFGLVGAAWVAIWFWFYRDVPSQKAGITAREIEEIGPPPADQHPSLPWGQALRSRNLWIIMAMYHTYCWGSYFYLSWLHTYLVKGRGFTEGEMQYYAALPPLCGVFGNISGGLLTDWLVKRRGLRVGRVTVGFLGLALSACFMLGTALTGNRLLAVAFLSLGYGSMDCMLPTSWAVCLDIGRKYAGTVSACMNSAGQVGSFIISVLFGNIVVYFNGDFNAPLIVMACMLLLSAFLFLLIDPTRQLIQEPSVPEGAPEPQVIAAA